MKKRHAWYKSQDHYNGTDKQEKEIFKAKSSKFDPSKTVVCCCCARTCTKMELANPAPEELEWNRLADGWACSMCYRPLKTSELEEGAANG